MNLNTASEAVSFAKELETESAKFYENLAQRYAEGKEIFLSFAKENNKNIVQTERAYFGVISDAIEGCFSFKGIDTDNYSIETTLSEGRSYADALNMAVALEEKIVKFYTDAAEVSKSLMADVPQAFERIAKKRNERILKLKSLL
ncbi:MAG: ferritin-like domain-containing protein [Dehalococcoidia bacterium]|nr:ferritin-like domain-containing protein [Dehalococcoidia bacterium]